MLRVFGLQIDDPSGTRRRPFVSILGALSPLFSRFLAPDAPSFLWTSQYDHVSAVSPLRLSLFPGHHSPPPPAEYRVSRDNEFFPPSVISDTQKNFPNPLWLASRCFFGLTPRLSPIEMRKASFFLLSAPPFKINRDLDFGCQDEALPRPPPPASVPPFDLMISTIERSVCFFLRGLFFFLNRASIGGCVSSNPLAPPFFFPFGTLKGQERNKVILF